MVAAFGTVQPSAEPPVPLTLAVESLPIELPAATDEASAADFWTEERFQSADTLAALLERLGIDSEDVNLLRRFQGMAFRSLRPGAIVQARVGAQGELRSLWFISGRDRLVTIDRDKEGFRLSEQSAPLARGIATKSAQIRSSLFAATDAANIPDSVASQLADIFAADIDFHRDLRQGDRLAVLYETHSFGGRDLRAGRVLAAEIVNQSRSYRAFWYDDPEGAANSGSYYTAEGKSLRKAFLRSPLEFSRISSGFGMRMHPIQQRWRAHNGVDYAAAQGTRVKATADGVVGLIGSQGGYGNVIELRHHGGFSTWYAHLAGFARGLRPGSRVSQGEVIGFVGQTGWATGPHLHYEFRVNNQYRNPLTLAFPAAHPLPGSRLPAFMEYARPLASQLEILREANLALLE
jgi:murein DD-endopeptidase MepM/ murein hydrolase activator NlpD